MDGRRSQGIVRVCAVLGATLVLVMLVAAVPVASARTTNCNLSGKYRSLGPTYVEKLSVSGVSCTTGANLIKSYNKCRLQHGGSKGSCRSKINGFSFSEKRQWSSIEFIAVVTAKNGRETVNFTYTENTA
jgi:hypothetical protein